MVNKVETDRDIYCNSCIHWAGTKYNDNHGINTYLIDKRFILNLSQLNDYFLIKGYEVDLLQDNYYVIIKVTDEYFDSDFTFDSLLERNLIKSLYDFISEYRLK